MGHSTPENKTYIFSQPHSFVDYILEPLNKDSRFVIFQHRRIRSLGATIKRFIRSVLPGKHPNLWIEDIFPPEYIDILKRIKPCDKVIFWAIGNKKDISLISEYANTANFSSLLWDPLRQICHFSKREINEYPDVMSRLGVKVCTFDKADALKYRLTYLGQVFRYPDIQTETVDSDIDVFFIGIDKGRGKQLNQIAKYFEENDIIYRFRILFDKHSKEGKYPILDKDRISKPVEYKETLKEMSRAKCILEILQENQTGMSLRALEALFFGKKLITNNPYIKSEKFYRADNIYILNDTGQPWKDLKTFLNAPFKPIKDKNLLDQYDIKNWINQL